MTPAASHPGELSLRRVHAGEAVGGEVSQHIATCDACRARLEGFAEEQRRFEAEIPFDRFVAGVERAARTPRDVEQPKTRRVVVLRIGLALAACLAVVVGVRILPTPHGNGLKGDGAAGIEVVVGGDGAAQRQASTNPATPEALARGERVRLGLRGGAWKYAVVVSVDELGTVTPIYFDGAHSLELSGNPATQFLPDSLEFTGSGVERLIVVMSSSPLTLQDLAQAVKVRFDEARGNLTQLGTLDIPGEQFHRTFLKP